MPIKHLLGARLVITTILAIILVRLQEDNALDICGPVPNVYTIPVIHDTVSMTTVQRSPISYVSGLHGFLFSSSSSPSQVQSIDIFQLELGAAQ